MANVNITDAADASKFLKATGAGSDGDPFIPQHLETNSAAIKTAVETIDNAISGSEMQVDVVAALPAGTNAIGKLAANSGVDIGDVDVTSVAIPTTIYNGVKNVTTAGTRVTLASSQAILSGVTIKAKAANTGVIYVGDGSVSSSTGFALAASETVFLEVANLATVNLDSSVNGEGVTYIAT